MTEETKTSSLLGAEVYVHNEFGNAFVFVSEDEFVMEVFINALPHDCPVDEYEWLEQVHGDLFRLVPDLSMLNPQDLVVAIQSLLSTLGGKSGVEKVTAA